MKKFFVLFAVLFVMGFSKSASAQPFYTYTQTTITASTYTGNTLNAGTLITGSTKTATKFSIYGRSGAKILKVCITDTASNSLSAANYLYTIPAGTRAYFEENITGKGVHINTTASAATETVEFKSERPIIWNFQDTVQ